MRDDPPAPRPGLYTFQSIQIAFLTFLSRSSPYIHDVQTVITDSNFFTGSLRDQADSAWAKIPHYSATAQDFAELEECRCEMGIGGGAGVLLYYFASIR